MLKTVFFYFFTLFFQILLAPAFASRNCVRFVQNGDHGFESQRAKTLSNEMRLFSKGQQTQQQTNHALWQIFGTMPMGKSRRKLAEKRRKKAKTEKNSANFSTQMARNERNPTRFRQDFAARARKNAKTTKSEKKSEEKSRREGQNERKNAKNGKGEEKSEKKSRSQRQNERKNAKRKGENPQTRPSEAAPAPRSRATTAQTTSSRPAGRAATFSLPCSCAAGISPAS